MRRAAKVDGNQRAIVQALRAAGCTVQSLAKVGSGCPDLLVGYDPHNFLLEVKRPKGTLKPGRRELRYAQTVWQAKWRGQVATVETVDEALAAVGLK